MGIKYSGFVLSPLPVFYRLYSLPLLITQPRHAGDLPSPYPLSLPPIPCAGTNPPLFTLWSPLLLLLDEVSSGARDFSAPRVSFHASFHREDPAAPESSLCFRPAVGFRLDSGQAP